MFKQLGNLKNLWPRWNTTTFTQRIFNTKEISPSLCSLFNKSLATSCVPVEWKQAYVTPIHKKECVEPVTNYRPISLLYVNIIKRPGDMRV